MKPVAYARRDGSVSIVFIAGGARLVRAMQSGDVIVTFSPPTTLDSIATFLRAGFEPLFAESEFEFAERVLLTFHGVTRWTFVDSVPSDRTFRNAWRLERGTLSIDMADARELWMAKLRAERDSLLAKSDVLVRRARERIANQSISKLTRARQRLRDMPKEVEAQIAASQTPEQLKKIQPASFDEANLALR